MGIGKKPGTVSPGVSAGEVPVAIPSPGRFCRVSCPGYSQIAPALPRPAPQRHDEGGGALESHSHPVQKAGGKGEGRARCMFNQVLDLNLQ